MTDQNVDLAERRVFDWTPLAWAVGSGVFSGYVILHVGASGDTAATAGLMFGVLAGALR